MVALTGLNNLISISTTPYSSLSTEQKLLCEITEHNRKTDIALLQNGSDVELARGILKRYVQPSNRIFNLSFSYLPSLASKSVDGRPGRNYLNTLSQTKGVVYVLIKLDPDLSPSEHTCFITSYTEKLVRRNFAEQCQYYDVALSLEEQ